MVFLDNKNRVLSIHDRDFYPSNSQFLKTQLLHSLNPRDIHSSHGGIPRLFKQTFRPISMYLQKCFMNALLLVEVTNTYGERM